MKVIGMNNVGVIQREDGLYVCYNSEKYEWFLSSNINDAEIILGDKEFNFMRLKDLYQKDTHDKSKLNLVIELYVYFSDFEKSCFYKTLPQQAPQVAYAYEYVK